MSCCGETRIVDLDVTPTMLLRNLPVLLWSYSNQPIMGMLQKWLAFGGGE